MNHRQRSRVKYDLEAGGKTHKLDCVYDKMRSQQRSFATFATHRTGPDSRKSTRESARRWHRQDFLKCTNATSSATCLNKTGRTHLPIGFPLPVAPCGSSSPPASPAAILILVKSPVPVIWLRTVQVRQNTWAG